jgi:hypothetical protein
VSQLYNNNNNNNVDNTPLLEISPMWTEKCPPQEKMYLGDNDRMFNEICNFVFYSMSLPHSYAAAERIFSKLNLIKTKTRNRLLPNTCNNLMLSKELSHDKKCFTWKPCEKLLKKTVRCNSKLSK